MVLGDKVLQSSVFKFIVYDKLPGLGIYILLRTIVQFSRKSEQPENSVPFDNPNSSLENSYLNGTDSLRTSFSVFACGTTE